MEGASATNPTEAASSASLAADLRAGRIDLDGAIDQLVSEALRGPLAAGLTPEGRAGLEAHLRDSLRTDPNLSAMLQDLEE